MRVEREGFADVHLVQLPRVSFVGDPVPCFGPVLLAIRDCLSKY